MGYEIMRELRGSIRKLIMETIICFVITLICNYMKNPGITALAGQREFIVNIMIGITTGIFVGLVTAGINYKSLKVEKSISILYSLIDIKRSIEELFSQDTANLINAYKVFENNALQSYSKLLGNYNINDLLHNQNKEKFRKTYIDKYSEMQGFVNTILKENEFFFYGKKKKEEQIFKQVMSFIDEFLVIQEFQTQMFNTATPAVLLESHISKLQEKNLLNRCNVLIKNYCKVYNINIIDNEIDNYKYIKSRNNA